jgi:hypothetical protein
MKPKLKPPGTKRLKLECDVLLSEFDSNLNLRRYIMGLVVDQSVLMGTATSHPQRLDFNARTQIARYPHGRAVQRAG